MLKFDDGSHCHWSYRVGEYRSFLHWPKYEDVADYLATQGQGDDQGAQIVQIHGANCFCDNN